MKYLQEKLFFYRLHDAQDSRNSLWMIPMLKKPVLDSILDKHYTSRLGKQWISYANNQIKQQPVIRLAGIAVPIHMFDEIFRNNFV